ncbi:hypothetical protein ACOMHN_055903 [Nucella lapillus]
MAGVCAPQPVPLQEVLGEHLYAKVQELQGDLHATLDLPRLTGVLLELGHTQVWRLLQDRDLLQQAVCRVIEHVPAVILPPSTHRSASCGVQEGSVEDQLYQLVWRLEPHLAHHLTGMLLELSPSQVKCLLQSETQLTQAVRHAKTAYLTHHLPPLPLPLTHPPQDGGSGGEEEEEEEEMGERVYAEAEILYPGCAAKLTGMVLDMGRERVGVLLEDHAQLQSALDLAFSCLPACQPLS